MAIKKIHYKGASIQYQMIGEGQPVVLLHGFAEDSSIWESIQPALNHYQLIIPDLPGTGHSELIQAPIVSLEDYAACIYEIVAAEKMKTPVLIGHSMGGYIALAYAAMYPGDIKALGLFHSSAFADDAAKIETRLKAIEFIQAKGALAFLKTSIPGLFRDAVLFQPQIDQLLEKAKKFTETALIQYYKAMIGRPDRTQWLENAKIPVLFVAGYHDKAVPFNHILQQTHLPKIAYLEVLRESAHMGMLEQTTLSKEILANFLDSVYQEPAIPDSIFR